MPTTLTDLNRLAPVLGLHDGYIFSARVNGFDIHDTRGALVKVENGCDSGVVINTQRAKDWITGQIKTNLLNRCWLD